MLHLHLLHEAFLKGQDLHVRQLTFQARGVQKMVEALSGLGDRQIDGMKTAKMAPPS